MILWLSKLILPEVDGKTGTKCQVFAISQTVCNVKTVSLLFAKNTTLPSVCLRGWGVHFEKHEGSPFVLLLSIACFSNPLFLSEQQILPCPTPSGGSQIPSSCAGWKEPTQQSLTAAIKTCQFKSEDAQQWSSSSLAAVSLSSWDFSLKPTKN